MVETSLSLLAPRTRAPLMKAPAQRGVGTIVGVGIGAGVEVDCVGTPSNLSVVASVVAEAPLDFTVHPPQQTPTVTATNIGPNKNKGALIPADVIKRPSYFKGSDQLPGPGAKKFPY